MKPQRVLASLLICVALVAPALARAEAGDRGRAISALNGRWILIFELPDGSYQTPVEFLSTRDGKVEFTVLGNLGDFQIASAVGRLSGGKLSLDAATSWGKLRVNATLTDDERLQGTWGPKGFFARLFFKGEVRGERDRHAPPSTETSRAELFDEVWSLIDREFYDPRFNGADWRAARETYRPQAVSARSEGEFRRVVKSMLAELRSSHLDFFATMGDRPFWVSKREAQAEAITWRRQTETVGYLKIASFDGDEARAVEAIDRAFSELGDLPSLILDLRGNGGGGALGTAMRVGDYLFERARPVGYFVTREGLKRRGVDSIDRIAPDSLPVYSGYRSDEFASLVEREGGAMLSAGGGNVKPFRGRVVVLMDEYCGSAAEAFLSVVKETRAGLLVGRRSAGAMLGANFVSLDGGWMLMLPVMDFRTAGGARVEGVGVAPDVEVKAARRGDPELARALLILQEERRMK